MGFAQKKFVGTCSVVRILPRTAARLCAQVVKPSGEVGKEITMGVFVRDIFLDQVRTKFTSAVDVCSSSPRTIADTLGIKLEIDRATVQHEVVNRQHAAIPCALLICDVQGLQQGVARMVT